MRVIYQFFLLMWKNLTIHRRKFGSTASECFLPILFPLGLMVLKLVSENEFYGSSQYETKPIGLPQFPKVLGFVPKSDVARTLAESVVSRHLEYLGSMKEDRPRSSPFVLPTIEGFNTIKEAELYFLRDVMNFTMVIEFKNLKESAQQFPPRLTVILHPYRKESQVWHTGSAYDLVFDRHPRQDLGDQGFAYIETLVSRAVMTMWLQASRRNVSGADFVLTQKRFPVPEYVSDGLFQTLKLQLMLFVVLSFMMSVFVHTKNILHEKEFKIKESMRLMGMHLFAFWMSWFFTCFLFMLPVIVAFALVLKIDFNGDGALFAYSDPWVILVLLLCYGMSVVSFSMAITCLVNKGNDGVIVSGVVFLMEYVPYEIIYQRAHEMDRFSKFLSCISFNVALGLANYNTLRREARMEGVQWSNVNELILPGTDNFTHLDSIVMLLVDIAFHFILIWYLDNVYPGTFGVPKPYLFFLTRAYWCGPKANRESSDDYGSQVLIERNAIFFEREPNTLPVGVQMRGLRKVFGSKVSVSNLSLNIYQGQITVLLGHNGAGKTTTMSMLTGFIPPTSGSALVNGYDIGTNIQAVRKSLGLCPQYDVLFDVLTVKEHLWFFAKLKGAKSNNLKEEIDTMTSEIGLESKATTRVCEISSGQKRSLSVGISLMGDSKVVFLDEPSSGMDPSTRRLIWDLLQKKREGRTMLLSTHYMDEADTLGNRIAILVEGRLQCSGTPMFLKKLYGTGYHLVIEKEPKCDLKKLTSLIQRHVKSAQIESAHTFEVSYLLPDTERHKFPQLFKQLRLDRQRLNINGFGTTSTTMEEVFLRSEEINNEQELSQSSDHRSSNSVLLQESDMEIERFDNLNRGVQPLRGWTLAWSRFRALFWKRVLVTARHLPVTLLLYSIPAFVVFLYFLIERFMTPLYDQSTGETIFNLDKYWGDSPAGVFIAGEPGDGTNQQVYTAYRDVVKQQGARPVAVDDSKSLDEFLLAEQDRLGRVKFDYSFPVGVFFNTSGDITVLYNGQPYHTLFASINLVMNAVAKTLLNESYQLTLGLKPLPSEGEMELKFQMFQNHRVGFLIGMFVGMGYAMYSSSVVHFLLWERQSGVKHMQAICGVSMVMFWLPTFLWDACSFIIPTVLLFLLIHYAGNQAFIEDGNWALCLLAVILFVWAILPVMYAVHFAFESAAQGLAGILVYNLFSVLLANIVVFELTRPETDTEELGWWVKLTAMLLIPTFNLSECFKSIMINYHSEKLCDHRQDACEQGYNSLCCVKHPDLCYSDLSDEKCYEWFESYLDMDITKGIGLCLVLLVAHGVLGWCVVCAVEFNLVHRFYLTKSRTQNSVAAVSHDTQTEGLGESDVLAEMERINWQVAELQRPDNVSDPMLLVNLKKNYGLVTAVDGLSLGVTKNQCFGLLGQSGAGKTTVFRMLTGQTAVSGGNAYLNSFDVKTNVRGVQRQIGYCPQYDAHIGELTATETLKLYGRLRGIPPKDLEEMVRTLIKIALLGPHANRRCGNYSGGNRRKLSLAMALVGNPDFLLLDEPSCGMDPKARRQMWDVLCRIRASGKTLVVSSHSMEECDAVCSKLVILLHGRPMCLGSPQHLKNKYGQGYTLVIKMGIQPDGNVASTEPVVEFVQRSFPDTILFDNHQGYVHLQIKDPSVELADVFYQMERCRLELEVEDYSVKETTLEQVFLMFTMLQRVQEERPTESCWFLRSGFFGDNICL